MPPALPCLLLVTSTHYDAPWFSKQLNWMPQMVHSGAVCGSLVSTHCQVCISGPEIYTLFCSHSHCKGSHRRPISHLHRCVSLEVCCHSLVGLHTLPKLHTCECGCCVTNQGYVCFHLVIVCSIEVPLFVSCLPLLVCTRRLIFPLVSKDYISNLHLRRSATFIVDKHNITERVG